MTSAQIKSRALDMGLLYQTSLIFNTNLLIILIFEYFVECIFVDLLIGVLQL